MATETAKKKTRRNSNPGVRVVGGRIYDSQNGKTCHQCRQKTMDFVASCKNLKANKPCVISYCHKCLQNRYGKKAEEVSLLDDWICPKCTGICNCSVCMKTRGCKPTGIMVHAARRTGYSSVSDLLQVSNDENLSQEDGQHPKESVTKKNVASKSNENNSKKTASKRAIKISNGGNSDHASKNGNPPEHVEASEEVAKKKLKRKGKNKINTEDDESHSTKKALYGAQVELVAANGAQVSRKRKSKVLKEVPEVPLNNALNSAQTKSGVMDEISVTKQKAAKRSRKLEKCNAEHQNKESGAELQLLNCTSLETVVELQLPKCTSLETVAGVALPEKDVGNALQFLEFCAAFGKVLDMKKGQAESIIRELVPVRHSRRQQYSPIVQILIQLLTLIQEDRGEKSSSFSQSGRDCSWIQALGKCIDESQCKLEDFPSDWCHLGVNKFDKLDSSKKLQLLNFMCDEALCTVTMRDWIDNQNSKFAEKKKEEKKEASAARNKEKNLKQKLQDEIAKAILKKNGAPLSIAEHDALVSQIKAEAAEAHAETVEAVNKTTKNNLRSDVVRTEAIASDANGNVFWELKGYDGKPNILYQDRGASDVGSSGDRWYLFEADQIEELEKYIYSLRAKGK